MCKQETGGEAAVYHKEPSLGLYDNLEEWDGEGGSPGRGYIHIIMTDSCFYTAETSTAL